MKAVIFIVSFFFCIVSYATNWLSGWETLAIGLSIFFLLDFLRRLGTKIIIMDLAIIMAALTCLFMPVIFYHFYTIENPLARLWVKYMPVTSEVYFSYVVPAVIAMAIGFRIPMGKLSMRKNPEQYIENAKKQLTTKPSIGLMLIGTGLISGIFDFLSPESLKQVFYFLDHLSFVGVFYVIYSPNKYKKTIVPVVILLTVAESLITGMFGDMVMILACSLVLVLLGRKLAYYKKLLICLFGIYFLLILQSVKPEYRDRIWKGEGEGGAGSFIELAMNKIGKPEELFDANKLFFVSLRMNQGWLVATTMQRVPTYFDFAYGETIWQSVAAAIVPRFLWPDKPETGGKANLKRFWGFDLRGFSMNIGPLGEGYANFDVTGGIFYMFFYALFFNFMLTLVVRLTEKRPTIILWIPFLFFYAIVVETDLLTTMGSLIKGIIFTWIIFRAYRIAFRIDL